MKSRHDPTTGRGPATRHSCRRAALRLFMCLLVLVVPAFVAIPAEAAMYTWKDDTGSTWYVDDLSKIPAKYRKSAQKIEEDVVEPPPPLEKAAPVEPKEEVPPPPQHRRIEGKTYIGSAGESSYYFDRTRVVVSGQGSTLQYSLGILEINEKTGEQKGGALHLWCGNGRTDMESVRLPDEYVPPLMTKFCSLPEGGVTTPQEGAGDAPVGQEP